MQRIYIPGDIQTHTTLSSKTQKEVVHYLQHVLRLGNSDQFIILDGKGTYATATIVETNKQHISLEIHEIVKKEPNPQVTLAIPIVKPATCEQIIAQTVQLGITDICFYQADFSQGHYLRALESEQKRKRLLAICAEHMEQSEQTYLPTITWPPIPFDTLLETGKVITALERKNDTQTLKKIPDAPILMIGPEGGFSPAEQAILRQHAITLSLSPHILRVETAAVCLAYEVTKRMQATI